MKKKMKMKKNVDYGNKRMLQMKTRENINRYKFGKNKFSKIDRFLKKSVGSSFISLIGLRPIRVYPFSLPQ